MGPGQENMLPIQRILCPIDFSEASRHAIDHATAIAGWYKASLIGLHVDRSMLMHVPGFARPVTEEELKRLHAETFARFETARGTGVDVDVLIDTGQPAHQILDRAASLPANLIVMGTHGASGFEHLVLGSVTEKVLRKAPCPVLTVPPHAQATSRLPFRRLLCAVDFSDWSLAAIELAFSLAQESSADVTLVHVIEWPWHEPPPPRLSEIPPEQAAALAEYRRYLEQTALARLAALTLHSGRDRCITAPRVVHGKPYVEILRLAAEDVADLIVMGVHGRSAGDVMLFGSTTTQVIRRATCPVLTVRQ
jgi:nucleotide-binding universal stress UspA family protein